MGNDDSGQAGRQNLGRVSPAIVLRQLSVETKEKRKRKLETEVLSAEVFTKFDNNYLIISLTRLRQFQSVDTENLLITTTLQNATRSYNF